MNGMYTFFFRFKSCIFLQIILFVILNYNLLAKLDDSRIEGMT